MKNLTFKQHVKLSMIQNLTINGHIPSSFEVDMINDIADRLDTSEVKFQIPESDLPLSTNIVDCELSTRTINCITYYLKVKTVGELLELTERDLVKTRNFGRQSLHEVRNFLKRHNLQMKGNMI